MGASLWRLVDKNKTRAALLHVRCQRMLWRFGQDMLRRAPNAPPLTPRTRTDQLHPHKRTDSLHPRATASAEGGNVRIDSPRYNPVLPLTHSTRVH